MLSSVSSSVTPPYPGSTDSAFAQRRAAFQALASALQTGDLAGAQKAFATLQSSASNPQGTQAAPSSGQNGPLGNDIQALGSALQSGDLAGAQKAFATLQADMQKVHGHHHHHHHQQPQADAVPTTPTTAAGSTIDLQT